MSIYFRKLDQEQIKTPIFFQDWWLDAVCGKDGWYGYVLCSGNFTKAIWPVCIQKRKFGRTHIVMPQFTPFLGPIIFYPENQKYSTKLSYEKEVINELIKKIGKFDHFHQVFSPVFSNWLPFFWNGFKQTTYYTYRLNYIQNHKTVFDNFQNNIKREIRKAQRTGLTVNETNDFDVFFECVEMTYKRQAKKIVFKDTLQRIWSECKKRNCGKMLVAKDKNQQIHSSIFIVWDHQTAYYLIGGSDPKLRNSGAMSLLMFESIKFASSKVNCFDFEGSMIEPIERFFRGFGAEQTQLFSLTKISRKEKIIQKIISLKTKTCLLK